MVCFNVLQLSGWPFKKINTILYDKIFLKFLLCLTNMDIKVRVDWNHTLNLNSHLKNYKNKDKISKTKKNFLNF